ncbi:MAG: helix-turn-helix domain-containing protein [Anaerolineales bacterium]|nr:helix-turn-helix domain-containing protein [Anaerolineales bacterium]
MPITTRQKILDYLKRNRTVSSRELARALQMTPANARHHLGILAADGRVEVIRQRQEGRGRPEKIYRLAGALAGDNLSVLADALLMEAGKKVEMDALGKRIAGGRAVSGQPLMRKLASTVERLNSMHYQARWEAGAAGPRIILGHCPYSVLIKDHPELCQMDLALLSELLGGELRQTTKLESGAGGLPFCAFVLKPR